MVIIVQNDPEVPAGTYGELLVEFGIRHRTLSPFAGDPLPSVGDCAAAIVLGGAMGVHDAGRHPFLAQVREFVRDCVNLDVPFLGICLGGQLLADVMGAEVLGGRRGEKGTLAVELTREGREDPLFAGIDRRFVTFQWHDDSFEIPTGGRLLASSPACPHQAFCCGSRAYATQFHPEVTREIVDTWARWSEETVGSADEFVARFVAEEQAYRQASRQLLLNFLGIARIG